ncbi:zinc finger C3H1 domain-containing protein-like isoform X2 [Centruroides vittatus]|uniref:zinc finger C3H1 domain-containing protein-like isoform X2 n=1 Tax=Centruroides vittatus TaxID=120091 RepID=UPI00350F8956
MENSQSKKEESELEEGEISEDQDEKCKNSPLSAVNDQGDSSNKKVESNSFVNKPPFGPKRPQYLVKQGYRNRNQFFGFKNVPSFYGSRDSCSRFNAVTGNLQPVIRRPYFANNRIRFKHMPRNYPSIPYLNKRRLPKFCDMRGHASNAKVKNFSQNSETDVSFEELLEQYRQIKFLLKDLNEEEEKRLDENKVDEKYFKYTDGESGNKENRRKRKLSVSSKRCKQSVDHSVDKGKSIKRRYSDSSEKYAVSCENQSNTKTLSDKETSQEMCIKENNNEEVNLLELRKQALATLTKQTNLKALENSPEGYENSEINKNENPIIDAHVDLELPFQKEKDHLCNSLGDNYEQVEMDLDSDDNPDSSESILSRDDIDDKVLREQLLQSLFGKRKIQEQKEVLTENVQPEITVSNTEEVTETSNIMTEESSKNNCIEAVTINNTIPKPAPLVINLAEDSSSSNSDNETKDPETLSPDNTEALPASLEELLKQARKKSEKKAGFIKNVSLQTPSAVSKLSRAQQLEYRKLKEEIAKRESLQKNENKDSGNENLKQTAKYEEKLSLERLKLKKDKEKLGLLQLQLLRKKAIAGSAYNKVQQLKEQLAAAEKVAAADLKMVKMCSLEIKQLQTGINKRISDIKELEKECKSVVSDDSGKIERNNQSLKPSNNKSLTLMKNPTPKMKAEMNILTNRPKARMTGEEIAIEKKRLQTLEKEITTKLQELRKKSHKTILSKKLKKLNNSPKFFNEKNKKYTVDLPHKNVSNNGRKLHRNIQLIKKEEKVLNKSDNSEKCLENLVLSKDKVNITEKFEINSSEHLENFKELQKEEHVLDHYSDKGVMMYSYQLCDIFWPKMKEINFTDFYQETCPQISVVSSKVHVDYKYNSPLLHINSYRLNPYFSITGKNLSSSSFAHGVNARSRICRFDLLGTCNDDQCTWQHYDDYKLNENEKLVNLLAFAPLVAKIEKLDNLQLCEKKLKKAADDFFHEYPLLSLEELCKIAVEKVNISLQNKAPYFVSFANRFWKPKIKNQKYTLEDNEFSTKIIKEWSCFDTSFQDDFDNLITENDQRYFNMTEKGIAKLEVAVTENPQNIQLWLKLAYKHLHNSEAEKFCLEQSLNVLSRALECNPHSPELWQHYLNMYSQHPSSVDILGVCRQAVGLCPAYEIWWKYLQFIKEYPSKHVICLEMLEYFTSKGLDRTSTPEILSHCILEVIIYQVQLTLQVEGYESAISLFKRKLIHHRKEKTCDQNEHSKEKVENVNMNQISDTLHIDETKNLQENDQFVYDSCMKMTKEEIEENSINFLTEKDYCFALLCYIYLFVFNSLPAFIFQNGQDNLGHIVSKDLFLIDWAQYSKLNKSKETIKETIEEILSTYLERCKNKDLYFPFYFQLITLELYNENYESAMNICRQLQELSSEITDTWLLTARIYIHQSLFEEASKVFEKAIIVAPFDPYLYYAASLFYFNNNNTQKAKDLLEKCIYNTFNNSIMSCRIPESAISLYCKLLEHNNEITHQSENQKKNEIPEKAQAYLWLNYILYLQCQNCSHSDIVIAFEAALSSFHSSNILKIIWWQYIHYSLFYVSSKGTSIKSLITLISECVISMPRNVSLPHIPGKFRTDYSFHTALTELFLTFSQYCFDKATMAERFLQMMPNNTSTIERAMYFYMTSGKDEFALSLIKKKLNNKVYNLNLWRMAIYLLLKENDQQEVHKTYNEAIQTLPNSAVLWKEYLKYEISENHKEHIEMIMEKCKKLQINIVDDRR